jgi:hypothetical protein
MRAHLSRRVKRDRNIESVSTKELELYRNVLGIGIDMSEYPVVESPEGKRYVCFMTLQGFFDPSWKWYVFGAIPELCSNMATIACGFITGRNSLGTFNINSLIDMHCKSTVDPAEVRKECPPPGWKLLDDKEMEDNGRELICHSSPR